MAANVAQRPDGEHVQEGEDRDYIPSISHGSQRGREFREFPGRGWGRARARDGRGGPNAGGGLDVAGGAGARAGARRRARCGLLTKGSNVYLSVDRG